MDFVCIFMVLKLPLSPALVASPMEQDPRSLLPSDTIKLYAAARAAGQF